MVAADARVAGSPVARLMGLVGRREIGPEQALGIPDCDWVHTFGVFFALDIAYCDRNGRVLRVVENLRPNRFGPRASGAYMTWEMRSGGFSGCIHEGQRLILQPSSKIESQTER
ncbi:MAG: DUF192 domain-containing protein [Armatimonadota bacterium]